MQRSTFSPASARGRRRAGLLLAGAVLAVPALTGCSKLTGFDVETDRPYVPAHGANYRVASLDAPVAVTGVVIVSGQDGSGTLIATFVNKTIDPAETPTITTEAVSLDGYEPTSLRGNEMVNLASDEAVAEYAPIIVEGDLIAPGASIPFTFGEGDVARELWVPVVPNEPREIEPAVGEHHEGEEGEEGEHEGGLGDAVTIPTWWEGLDRSTEPQAARPTVTPDAGTGADESSEG
ncbi:hypothetical protein QE364_000061 [Nocardioides zeae]|uniref:Uncharacterized protein n=2 Tax=Nocardioides zeae TaxID=1457234 RepID=A0ACC6ICJ0_9ACTN|nr:hypothetical protein [Nocardioides zeae]MDQ1104848.1 hypothetical protein [Nocardioides zeae]MDR6175441.1 hypothetical protein [Nocardioides zeae]MDR6208373.1 hypothetical protein [Nocardioides zeae]